MSALSPSLKPVLMILVYPPSLSATFGAISRKSSVTAYLFFRYEKQTLLEWVESVFDFVIKGSTYLRSAFALATVVLMRLCSINEQAMFANIASLWGFVLPRWLNFLPCLMVLGVQ